MKILLRYWK